ncbi:MAG: hypothetical protein GX196_07495 [Clostridiaceae bacterium]|nr:hypothetical protein [Clostridiaceae bacterium]
MADKLGILINTILNVKQENLQKQIDSVAKKVKILNHELTLMRQLLLNLKINPL